MACLPRKYVPNNSGIDILPSEVYAGYHKFYRLQFLLLCVMCHGYQDISLRKHAWCKLPACIQNTK